MPEEAVIDAPPLATIPEPSQNTVLPEFSKSMDRLFNNDGSLKDIAAPVTPAPEPKPAAPEPKPAATTTPPKADAPAVEDWKEMDPPDTVKTEQGKTSWRSREAGFKKRLETERTNLGKERDKAVGELAEARKNLEELQKKAERKDVNVADLPEYKALKAEHERLTKEIEDYSKQLRIADVTRHPKFKAHFDGRTQQVMDYAKKVGGDKAVELLKMPDSEWRTQQINELVSELGMVNGGLLVNAMAQLAQITGERDSAIAAEEANWKSMKEQEHLVAQQKREASEKSFADVLAEVQDKDKGLPVFQERDGDGEWNKGVAERRALAQSIYQGGMDPRDMARAAIWSAAAPALMQALRGEQEAHAAAVKGLNEKIATYEAEIKKLRDGTPSPGSDTPDPNAPTPEPINGVRSMVDDMAKRGLFPA